MTNRYFEEMVKAAAVFPSPSTLSRMAKASPFNASSASRSLAEMHEHSSAIGHLAARHAQISRSLEDEMTRVSQNGTSHEAIQNLRDLRDEKEGLEERLAAHHEGMRWHEREFNNRTGSDAKYTSIKNAGPVRDSRPGADSVHRALLVAKHEGLF